MKKIAFSIISSHFFKEKGIFIYQTNISISSEVSSRIENMVREFGGNADYYKIQCERYIIPVYYFPTEEGYTWFKKSIELEFNE